jgi:FixJ family two-component response regulator
LQHDPDVPGCAIFDLAMPRVDGLELQRLLYASGIVRPIIFVTGRGDIPTSVRAMKAGAVDFLTKPVTSEALLEAVARARDLERKTRQNRNETASIEARLAKLTAREREVFVQVVAGRLNKQIASDLGIVEKTIKVHRGRMMNKLEVRTVQDLVRLADRASITPEADAASVGRK